MIKQIMQLLLILFFIMTVAIGVVDLVSYAQEQNKLSLQSETKVYVPFVVK